MKNYRVKHLKICIDLEDLYKEVLETYPNITKEEIEQVFEESKNDFIKNLKDVNKDNLEDGEEKIFINF